MALSLSEKERLKEKAIKEKGFHDPENGLWNAIITFHNDKHIYRYRVETIVVRNNKEVFVKKKPNGEYALPGGSVEKDIPNIDQAVNECHEEAHIKVDNIESTGLTYKELKPFPNWAKEKNYPVKWDGYYTEIYIGEYGGKFTGHIDEEDEDPFIRSGNWMSIKECLKLFRKEHREALVSFIKRKDIDKELKPLQESNLGYALNYFNNIRLLKKFSKNPDVSKDTLNVLIKSLTKAYKDLINKSKTKRLMKSEDVKSTVFFIKEGIRFPDGEDIAFVLCFDKSEYTPAAATQLEDGTNAVICYPSFFSLKNDTQIFVLLHEIGHIRLKHVKSWATKTDLFGNPDYNDYRGKVMYKGDVMYPEANADLYAILAGASMYTILDMATRKDYDKESDFRISNAEITKRYNTVYKKYKKYHGLTYESRYDIDRGYLYEAVYGGNIDASKDQKDRLYSICYESIFTPLFKHDTEIEMYETSYNEELVELHDLQRIYMDSSSKLNKISANRNEIIEESEQNDESPISTGDVVLKEIEHRQSVLESLKNHIHELESEIYEGSCEDIILTEYGERLMSEMTMKSKDSFRGRLIDTLESINVNDYEDEILIESLSKAERDKIPTSKFGIEDTRSYPLDTKKHVKSAIKLFYKAPNCYKKELAKKIKAAMDEYKIPLDSISKDAEIRKYL